MPADIRRALGIQEGDKVEFHSVRRIGSVTEATAGAFKKYADALGHVLTAEQLREAAALAIASDGDRAEE